MKRILYVITSLDYGGAQKNLFLLVSNLPTEKYRSVVVTLKSGGYYSELFTRKNITLYDLKLPETVNFQYCLQIPKILKQLKEIIEKEKPDIVHSFLFQANILSRLAARSFGIPTISSERVQELQKFYHHFLNRLTACLVKIFTVNSRDLKNFLLQKLKLPEEKIVIIPNIVEIPALDKQNLEEKRKWLRNKYLLLENIPVILSVGRLHYQKGFDILLRTLSRISFPYYCFIIGDGPERNNLKNLWDVLELRGKVFFTGWVDHQEINNYYQAADIFVLTSRWEGMPNVLLEARANSLAIISSSVSGVSEIVTDGEDGLIVPVNDEEKLELAIEKLLSDDALREQFRYSGRQKLSRFSVSSVIFQIEALYERIQTKSNCSFTGL